MPAPKKTIITPEVGAVLSTLTINGDRVYIAGQLDRALYLQVNAVLEALGGVWKRGTKGQPGAHVFEGVEDLAEAISRTITAGEITLLRDLKASLGWFPTPGPIADALVDVLELTKERCPSILEPNAGEGALIEAALRAAPTALVFAVEIDPGRAATLRRTFRNFDVHVLEGDFASDEIQRRLASSRKHVDRVLMNPPFCKVGNADHLDHVRIAQTWLGPRGRLGAILPSSITFRQDARHAAFREWVERQAATVSALPRGSFKPSQTNVETVMLTIVR